MDEMSHAEQHRAQDRDLTELKIKFDTLSDDADSIVDRLQKLVEQYYAQNVSFERLSGDIRHLTEKIQEVHVVFHDDHVSRMEFLALRKIVYWGITVFTGIVIIIEAAKFLPK